MIICLVLKIIIINIICRGCVLEAAGDGSGKHVSEAAGDGFAKRLQVMGAVGNPVKCKRSKQVSTQGLVEEADTWDDADDPAGEGDEQDPSCLRIWSVS